MKIKAKTVTVTVILPSETCTQKDKIRGKSDVEASNPDCKPKLVIKCKVVPQF